MVKSSPSTTKGDRASAACNIGCTWGAPPKCAGRAEEVPISYVVFDLLHLDGHDVTPLPYTERRRLLAELVPDDGCWTVPRERPAGEGQSLLDAAKDKGSRV